ncbi:DJ-1/PfpI family protein [Roseateles sp. SL47]|uniref:DJ-1/PfpI family protein n=1 Tax=Roseateles sp. SL47 TaxID=2995138 RepID=UPI00226E39AF|nr:DJ-1/PfpI family protein [Roseateles sp. SL47]WAC74382.1 DJ-1/PfpI family protein [Roseateles sp. SL47]
MQVGILIFDNVELLDMAGPYEVFTTASRVHARSQPADTPPLFEVITLARKAGSVCARAGLRLLPDCLLGDHPHLDCTVVPGGVVNDELGQDDLMRWIASQSCTAQILASVCTGALLLANAGVLDGLEVTTHWEDINELRTLRPGLHVTHGPRWIDQGSIVTSAGISAGIDMSLHLVERLHSRELALRTARQMDFEWTEAA